MDAWWRTFAVALMANLAAVLPALLIATPAAAVAQAVAVLRPARAAGVAGPVAGAQPISSIRVCVRTA